MAHIGEKTRNKTILFKRNIFLSLILFIKKLLVLIQDNKTLVR